MSQKKKNNKGKIPNSQKNKDVKEVSRIINLLHTNFVLYWLQVDHLHNEN